jgi:hypothetical protein
VFVIGAVVGELSYLPAVDRANQELLAAGDHADVHHGTTIGRERWVIVLRAGELA